MVIWSSVLFPFLLGLLGFIEPCSLGANLIFLQYMLPLDRASQFFQGIFFTLTRALFLSLIGLLSALIGQQVIGIQGHYVQFLGALYLIVGLFVLVKGATWRLTLPFPRLSKTSLPVLMGAAFGLAVPASASPLVLALAGGAALSGQLWFGFISLFVFGLGLSLPLLVAIYSEKSREIMTRTVRRHPLKVQYLVGMILVLAGLYTLLAGSGSLNAILGRS